MSGGGDASPQVFYSDEEARKYTSNSHMIATQEQLTQRALELLALPDDGPKARLQRRLAAFRAARDARHRRFSCCWTWAVAAGCRERR